MNTRILTRALGAALILSLALASCKKDLVSADDALGLVPATSASVVRIDIPGLMKKADFERFRQSPMYRDAVEDARKDNPTLAKVMEQPGTSGVDLDQMGYVFFDINPEKARESFNGLLLSLKDAGQFETLIRSGEDDVHTKGPIRYVLGGDDNIVAWNGQFALFGNSNALINLVEKAEQILKTKPQESVAMHKDLQKAFAEAHDFTLWFSSDPIAEAPELQLGSSMAEIDEDALKDNFVHGYLDFLDGRIEGQARFFLQSKLSRELNKVFRDEVRTDFAQYIPGGQVAMLLTNALNMEGIEEVISARSQSKGFLEFGLKDYDLKIKDFRETFGGDIALAAVETANGKKIGLFATDIKDREKLQRFLDIAMEQEAIEKEGDNLYRMRNMTLGRNDDFLSVTFDDGAPRLLVKDNILFIAGDAGWLAQVQEGGFSRGERLEGELSDKLKNHLFSAYFNTRALGAFDGDPEVQGVKDLDIQADRNKISLRVRMDEEKMNALKYLLQRAEQQYEQKEERGPELQ